MAKLTLHAKVAAGCLALCGTATPVLAQPKVADVLRFHPKQEGVAITTPTEAEQAACKLELAKGRRGSGWVLTDGQGRTLRRFFDTSGAGRVDTWAYYKDGNEVYREVDSNGNGKADQYRWLNTAGMKWGVDENEDGKIDGWKMISPEEVSQEVVQALIMRDLGRLQALMASDAELKALELPAAEVARITEAQKATAAKFQAALTKLPGLNDKARWLHLEAPAPQCLPADQTGMKKDLFRIHQATVLLDLGGKNEWIQTGEMIQVGLAWRLVDAPSVGLLDAATPSGGNAVTDTETKKLLDELNKLDAAAPKSGADPGVNAELAAYNLKRADLIERIAARSKGDDRDPWIRQLADCLGTAAQHSPATDKTAMTRLLRLEEQVATAAPGSNLAAYVTFREMSADYAIKLAAEPQKFEKVQEGWVERLTKFVQTYAKADDAADALFQLGMVHEFLGKEIPAKNWYNQLVTNFPASPLSAKAKGAVARLESEGKALTLAGPTLADGKVFDIAALQGKVVAVYYWASWNQTCVGDFAKLKLLLDKYAAQGLELVAVNLDASAEEATTHLKRSPSPGTHLYQAGGLESPLAAQYGINVLPHLFLIGKDGKVVSRTVQVGSLEDEVKKLLK